MSKEKNVKTSATGLGIKMASAGQDSDSVIGESFSLANLSATERTQAEQIGSVVSTLAMKGLLNRLNPKKYPVLKTTSSIEAHVAKLAMEIPAKVFDRLRPRLEKAAGDAARMKRIFGKLGAVDLQKPDLSAVFAKLPVKPVLQMPVPPENAVKRSGAKYNRLDLILRKLHCVDETNPEGGDDDMILGGVVIGASGIARAPKAFVAGHFDDGDMQNFGEYPFWQFNMNTTSGYPKSFYCIFKLVESDSDDKEVAEDLTATLSFLANTIISAFAGQLVGKTAGAVLSAIGGFFSGLIDEDEFPPYAIRLKMNSENPFGSSDSPNMHTEDIRAHGGRYRIGYKWSLNA